MIGHLWLPLQSFGEGEVREVGFGAGNGVVDHVVALVEEVVSFLDEHSSRGGTGKGKRICGQGGMKIPHKGRRVLLQF